MYKKPLCADRSNLPRLFGYLTHAKPCHIPKRPVNISSLFSRVRGTSNTNSRYKRIVRNGFQRLRSELNHLYARLELTGTTGGRISFCWSPFAFVGSFSETFSQSPSRYENAYPSCELTHPT